MENKIHYHPKVFEFIPEENKYVIRNGNSSGQIRTNGRIALMVNYYEVVKKIESKLSQIINIEDFNNNFQSIGRDIDVHVSFSLAGGTGSGTFIDVAYLVKEIFYSKYKGLYLDMFGYAILPDVFNAMMKGPAMSNVLPNSYAALYELDYLMDYRTEPLEIYFPDRTIKTDTPIFNEIYIINNKNSNNSKCYKNIRELTEIVGFTQFLFAGELFNRYDSSKEGLITVLAGGALDIENKRLGRVI